jgi:uncharacterized protein YneR
MKFRDFLILEDNGGCETLISYEMLDQAKKWWLQRLDVNFDKNLILRIAITKYGKNQPSQQLSNQIMVDIEKSKQQINSINKINYVNEPDKTANAYWQPGLPNQISVNCPSVNGVVN